MRISKNIICVEGADCTGKTTLVNYLSNKYDLIPIQSPGQTQVGLKIREILKSFEMPSIAQQCLFNASDAIVFSEIYKENEFYIFDRYWLSRIVYQYTLKSEKLDIKEITKIMNRMADVGIIFPLTTFVLYAIDINVLLNRMVTRNIEMDVFEKQGIYNINNAYFETAKYLKNHLDMNIELLAIDGLSVSDIENIVTKRIHNGKIYF